MIQIDKQKQKIYFYPDRNVFYERLKDVSSFNNNDPDTEKQLMKCSFDLMNGYICPTCNMIISAAYIGRCPVNPDCYSSHLNNNNKITKGKYENNYCSYSYNNIESICIDQKTHSDNCNSYITKSKGYINPLRECLKLDEFNEDDNKPTNEQLKEFSRFILDNKIPGINYLYDICNNDYPCIIINYEKFCLETEEISEINRNKFENIFSKKLLELIDLFC